ncbi:MAG: DUF1295 domain-containing protein [Kangiellaceae bacterium]|nr:DUF1295 domain-containing protein [Kangiellaceae bacterium]
MLNWLQDYPLLFTGLLCVVLQLSSWLWQIKTKNTDIVDITWSALIVLCGLVYFISANGNKFHSYLILLIPALWYSRLAWHLIARYQVNREDGRYKALREHWSYKGKIVLQFKLLLFFVFQAALAWMFSYPAYIIANLEQPPSIFDSFGMILLIISFLGVTLSDRQLIQFKKSQKANTQSNTVCNVGFWRYSRHPNYFFEWLHWFCYPLFGLSMNNLLSIDWIILLAAPFVMLLFLLKLTGIPYNEQQNLRSKGDAYRKYQKTTNKFFLGKPKAVEDIS